MTTNAQKPTCSACGGTLPDYPGCRETGLCPPCAYQLSAPPPAHDHADDERRAAHGS